jgi:D-galactarolactone cycloisomerase
MKIIEIRGYHLGFPLADPVGNALSFFHRREFLLVEVVTDSGISGWGEVGASPHAGAALIRTKFAPLVLGQSPAEAGRLWHLMRANMHYDRRGAAAMAIAGLDMALHDVAARAQGVSVAAMLGGALRTRVMAYASGPFIRMDTDPYGRYLAETEAFLRKNFRAIKPRCGIDPRKDGAMALAQRDLIGPDIALMMDVNQGYTARAAIESAKRMEAAELLWLEEPVQPENIPGYQTVRAAVDVAIAGGEALGSLAAFREFFEADTFSIAQPDLSVCGGFTGFRQIAALADAFEIPVMPHVFGSVVNFYASLQMAALLPARRGGGPAPYPFVEFDGTENPLLHVLGEPTLNADGTFSVPDGPGFGIELTAERLAPWMLSHWQEGV